MGDKIPLVKVNTRKGKFIYIKNDSGEVIKKDKVTTYIDGNEAIMIKSSSDIEPGVYELVEIMETEDFDDE